MDGAPRAFPFLVSDTQRDPSLVAARSPHFDRARYPARVVVARHTDGSSFEFLILPSPLAVACAVLQAKDDERRLFAVVEADQPCFLFLDVDLPRVSFDPARHGTDFRALVIHNLKVVCVLISELCGSVSGTALMRDVRFGLFESSNDLKFSAHVHASVAFPSIAAAQEIMSAVKRRMQDMHEEGLACSKPLFYWRSNVKNRAPFWEAVVDFTVYSKNRNFRLPLCTKTGKRSWLRWCGDFDSGSFLCAAGLAQESDQILAGMILCCNSAPLWTDSNSYVDASGMRHFRCLPTLSMAREYCAALRANRFATLVEGVPVCLQMMLGEATPSLKTAGAGIVVPREHVSAFLLFLAATRDLSTNNDQATALRKLLTVLDGQDRRSSFCAVLHYFTDVCVTQRPPPWHHFGERFVTEQLPLCCTDNSPNAACLLDLAELARSVINWGTIAASFNDASDADAQQSLCSFVLRSWARQQNRSIPVRLEDLLGLPVVPAVTNLLGPFD